MARQFRVMWVCDIVAEDEADAACRARHTIANASYSYFDVYGIDESSPVQVEVPNDGTFIDCQVAHPYYPLLPKTNN